MSYVFIPGEDEGMVPSFFHLEDEGVESMGVGGVGDVQEDVHGD